MLLYYSKFHLSADKGRSTRSCLRFANAKRGCGCSPEFVKYLKKCLTNDLRHIKSIAKLKDFINPVIKKRGEKPPCYWRWVNNWVGKKKAKSVRRPDIERHYINFEDLTVDDVPEPDAPEPPAPAPQRLHQSRLYQSRLRLRLIHLRPIHLRLHQRRLHLRRLRLHQLTRP